MKKVLLGVIVFSVFVFWLHGNTGVCDNVEIIVPKGGSMQTVERILVEKKCIRSGILFGMYTRILNSQVKQGTYKLEKSLSLRGYVTVFTDPEYKSGVRMVIPEGFTNEQIAARCARLLSNCNAENFITKTKDVRGFLFPNTYFFSGNENEDIVIATMQKEFEKNVRSLLQKKTISLDDAEIINLASIVEKEANTEESMKMVADILIRRLQIGMALQVDATLFYERGEASKDLSIADLRRDSPYNTYTNVGLPPTAIANPGLVAIRSVLAPTPNKNLFYLTGKDGKMYYARTHDEHVRNKVLYLR